LITFCDLPNIRLDDPNCNLDFLPFHNEEEQTALLNRLLDLCAEVFGLTPAPAGHPVYISGSGRNRLGFIAYLEGGSE
jgi:hypothetical protein